MITKAQRRPIAKSIDLTYGNSNSVSREISSAMIEPSNYMDEVDANLWVSSKGLTEPEKLFLELKLEGLTMEEITEDLGESAYKVRQTLREKLHTLRESDA